jgi:hypothetical protein
VLCPDFPSRGAALQSDSLGSSKLGRALCGDSAIMLILRTIMRSLFLAILTLTLWLPAGWGQSAKQLATVLGSWEGESKCMVADSPCHDEQVLYQVSTDRKDPERLNLDAYKMVDGAPDFMGTLECQYHAKQGALSCTGNTSRQDDWEFHVFGESMSGTLKIEGGKLYRRIALHKAKDK